MAIISPENWPAFDIDDFIKAKDLRNTDPKIIEPVAQLAEYEIKSNFDQEQMVFVDDGQGGLKLSDEDIFYLTQARYALAYAYLMPHIYKDLSFDSETMDADARQNLYKNESLRYQERITGFISIAGTMFGEF